VNVTQQWVVFMLQVNDSEIQPTFTFFHPPNFCNTFMHPSPQYFKKVQLQNSLQKWIPKLQQVAYVISEKKSSCTNEKLEMAHCRL
jgi:hypothetical protein